VATSRQLEERGFWVEVDHDWLRARIKYPGLCIRASEVASPSVRRAPRVGEHNVAVYGELGLSRKELVTLRRRGVI
jgi:crotonobetainyl-CoA:carnitine CoA-transferase CaiB-like acyl-CoA transferase